MFPILMVMAPASHIVRQTGDVTREQRARILGHQGAVVWLTGLSGSGKSTIGFALERTLCGAGHLAYVLDGDNVRHGLCSDLGFSTHDRDENVRRVGEVAALLADAGAIVIACFISPFVAGRAAARRAAGEGRFFEVFLATPLQVCEERDPKGLYRKARAGQIPEFTGVSSPYEPPDAPELLLHPDRETVAEDVQSVVALLRRHTIVP
jgi:adenylyl-sulfate kinase